MSVPKSFDVISLYQLFYVLNGSLRCIGSVCVCMCVCGGGGGGGGGGCGSRGGMNERRWRSERWWW